MKHPYAVAERFPLVVMHPVDGEARFEWLVVATFQSIQDAVLFCDMALIKGREVKVTRNY